MPSCTIASLMLGALLAGATVVAQDAGARIPRE